MKAIVITPDRKEYDEFILDRQLKKKDYPWINDTEKIRGYKNTIAFCVGTWYDLYGTYYMAHYCDMHNIDMIRISKKAGKQ